MLQELEIENFALVERLQVPFGEGLNVLTGETGAGKSILLDALDYLLGGGPPSSRPQTDTAARVAGQFRAGPRALQWLSEQGYESGEEILLSRESSAQGRSSGRINGRLATSAQMRALGDLLVEIHGQHQSTQLLRPSLHLRLLDTFCGGPQSQRLEEYRIVHARLRDVEKQLHQLDEQARGRAREEEWLHHERRDISEANLTEGEEEELERRLRRLQGLEELQTKLSQALAALSGERGAVDLLSAAGRLVGALVRLDGDLQVHSSELEQAHIQISEVSRALQSYLEDCQADPQELDRLLDRKNLLRELKRKYGPDIPAILEYGQQVQEKLNKLQSLGDDQRLLLREQDELRQRRELLAQALGAERERQAVVLQEAVESELQALHLEKSQFRVALKAIEAGPQGSQEAEFLFSANPGSPPRPLTKVASGGELSRMLLALLVLLDRQNPIPTMVFDEVDAGLGGRAAESVARKLHQVAQGRQLLCVTHLPVIAAAANHHLRVVKSSLEESTQLSLTQLDPAGREEEIARMLSGDATPQVARSHARELLRKAH